jgi:predicted chitinase
MPRYTYEVIAMTVSSDKSPTQRAFSHYLRTGRRLPKETFLEAQDIELKFNPYHDPRNGQFTFAPGGARTGSRPALALAKAKGRAGSNHIVVAGEKLPSDKVRTSRNMPTSAASPRVTVAQLRSIMTGSEQQAEVYADTLNRAMTKHGINTPQQRAAFLAQLSVESGNLRSTEENLDYSAKRLTQVWKRHFPTIASAEPYAHNPEALANYVYANRLGNGNEASGDGYRYRGRGLIQITGRENYRKVGYENNPDALKDPYVAAHSAAQFWTDRNLNARSKTSLSRDQFNVISRTVNGGNNASQERWNAYQRGLLALRP